MDYVCPQCRGTLRINPEAYACEPCGRVYPVICGIPDFRLRPDPYIGIEEDRAKGRILWESAQRMTFEELLRHYYDITEEDPPDLAAHWIPHSLAEPEIASLVLAEAGLTPGTGELLDIGCSTGGMLIAAARRHGWRATGVDVAFRWQVVGLARLRDAGVAGRFVCANAESLPFADESFDAVTAQDALEHVFDPRLAAGEGRRVSRPGATALWTTNNRWAPLPEPHLHLWGVAWLPRAWQARYVGMRRNDTHPYNIRMRGAAEIGRIFRDAGYGEARVTPAPLYAPHWQEGAGKRVLAMYNRMRQKPMLRQALRMVGPRLWVTARRVSG